MAFNPSSPFPVDQWIREVPNWLAVGVNLIQRSLADYATGPGEYGKYTLNAVANDAYFQWYRDTSILRDGGYTSISVHAIGLS